MDNQPRSSEFVKSLSDFFKRDLISIPLIKKYPHQSVAQRCGLKAATLELDTAAFPNIDYIAGNRLSIYPVNPFDHVNSIVAHLIDDINPALSNPGSATATATGQVNKRIKLSGPWAKWVQINGRDSLKLALAYLYDIMTAPSRDLLNLIADSCTNRDQVNCLHMISNSDESWEKWISLGFRTLKSTFDEFNSCKQMSAKSLFSHLTLQQPRQYSISSIKSSRRFRTEILVLQHKFTLSQISRTLQMMKEQEIDKNKSMPARSPGGIIGPVQTRPTTVHVNHQEPAEQSQSFRSLRSMWSFGTSPITTQQVKRIPPYAGPLMSLYASSSLNGPARGVSSGSSGRQSQTSLRGKSLVSQAIADTNSMTSASSSGKIFEGLCSNYLLNLNSNDHIVCEFVENPRFTLKGNRERPIMMIGQDIGVVAFRPFWQQRSFEHDRAQVFYTMFKDLAPKKFGDMQLVCLTGNKCKIEDLYKHELRSVVSNKILSSVTHINKKHLLALLDSAAASHSNSNSQIKLEPKELADLGDKISKLIVDHNGCLYTCCDPHMTQAIEILAVESIAKSGNITREKAMELLPKWKGRKVGEQSMANNKFLFTLENPFEKAQIVEEIYETV